MANNKLTHVVTGKVRLSYEHLMKPYANTDNDPKAEPKYSVTVLLPKSDTATMQKINGSDHYGNPVFAVSNDRGKSWSAPEEIPAVRVTLPASTDTDLSPDS